MQGRGKPTTLLFGRGGAARRDVVAAVCGSTAPPPTVAASLLDGTMCNRCDACRRVASRRSTTTVEADACAKLSRWPHPTQSRADSIDRGLACQVLAAIDEGTFKDKLEAGFEWDTWLDDNTVADDWKPDEPDLAAAN